MLIGTSLGRCMASILRGDVDGDKIGLIITRTRAEDFDSFMIVVKEYYELGNPTARGSNDYDLSHFEWENVEQLAHNLWYGGRIHQPRNFDPFFNGFLMPEMRDALWMEVVPTNTNSNPSVIEAYERYKVLDSLTK